MSEFVTDNEKLATPEQAAWLFEFIKNKLGGIPGGDMKFYRLDNARFANMILWDIKPELHYNLSVQNIDYLDESLPNVGEYQVMASSIVKFIDVKDPDWVENDDIDELSGIGARPGYISQEVQATEAEIAELIGKLAQAGEVPRDEAVAELEEAGEKRWALKNLHRSLAAHLDQHGQIKKLETSDEDLAFVRERLATEPVQGKDGWSVSIQEIAEPEWLEHFTDITGKWPEQLIAVVFEAELTERTSASHPDRILDPSGDSLYRDIYMVSKDSVAQGALNEDGKVLHTPDILQLLDDLVPALDLQIWT